MSADEWTMADGFAPPSRITYCQRPKACSALPTGRCSRCQVSPAVKAAFGRRTKQLQTVVPTAATVPTYVDSDFDDLSV